MGFVDNRRNIKYQQTYPFTQTTRNCAAKFLKQSPFESCESHDKHVSFELYKTAQYPHILNRTDYADQQLEYDHTAAVSTINVFVSTSLCALPCYPLQMQYLHSSYATRSTMAMPC